MTVRDKAQSFLEAMRAGEEADAAPAAKPQPVGKPKTAAAKAKAAPAAAGKPALARSELKHFGGYLDDATLEKIALLRVRLKLNNSELIVLAVEDLHRKHMAKRAFGDA